jgi:hypothetical protein
MPKGIKYAVTAGSAMHGQRRIANESVEIIVKEQQVPKTYTGGEIDIGISNVIGIQTYGDIIRKMKQKQDERRNKNKK